MVSVRILRDGVAANVALRLAAKPGIEALKQLYADCAPCFHDGTIIRHPRMTTDAKWTAFRAAGCDERGRCLEAAFAKQFGCDIAYVANGLGGLRPVTAMAWCYLPYRRGKYAGIYSVRGLPSFDVILIANDGNRFEPIGSPAEFVRRFAPVESPEEAMAFVLALTRHVTSDDLEIPPSAIAIVPGGIETPFAEAAPGGYHVHLYQEPSSSCGAQWIGMVDLFVGTNGDIQQTATQPVYQVSEWGNCVE
jgi:hypothetical protein